MIHRFPFGELTARLMPSGAVWFEEEKLLCVADLHFEKGSYFAKFGALLPPYDSSETLAKLERDIEQVQPHTVLCLGDSFHDVHAAHRMEAALLSRLNALIESLPAFLWITGNHDPEIAHMVKGQRTDSCNIGGISFQHQALLQETGYEVSGHYHPKAAVSISRHIIRQPCFLLTGQKLILPSYGAYTGGLFVTDKAFKPLLKPGYRVYLLHRHAVFAI